VIDTDAQTVAAAKTCDSVGFLLCYIWLLPDPWGLESHPVPARLAKQQRVACMKIAFIITRRKRNNVVVSFGTLKVQSFMLTEVRDCDLPIVVTFSTFLKSVSALEEALICLGIRNTIINSPIETEDTRLAFLGSNTPTPLISDILTQVDATILQALCRKGTTNAHGEWTAVFRRFVDMKLQLPHFLAGFGVTPNAGSAISAFYAASVPLVQWLGVCSHSEQNFMDLPSTCAPGQDLANPDQWTAPILIALKKAHHVLRTEFGWNEWSINGPAPASAVPHIQVEGSRPNAAANAPQSAPRNVSSPWTLLPLILLRTVDSNLDGNAQAPSVPAQSVITAHLMRFWPSHQHLLGNISLTSSEQTLGLQSSQRFKVCPTDPDATIFGLHCPTPPTDSQIQADPSFKKKTWHLNWMPLAFLASFRPER